MNSINLLLSFCKAELLASAARTIPANDWIAEALGEVSIGTFAGPPEPGRCARAIIDIYGESVVAIIPVRFRQEVLASSNRVECSCCFLITCSLLCINYTQPSNKDFLLTKTRSEGCVFFIRRFCTANAIVFLLSVQNSIYFFVRG